MLFKSGPAQQGALLPLATTTNCPPPPQQNLYLSTNLVAIKHRLTAYMGTVHAGLPSTGLVKCHILDCSEPGSVHSQQHSNLVESHKQGMCESS